MTTEPSALVPIIEATELPLVDQIAHLLAGHWLFSGDAFSDDTPAKRAREVCDAAARDVVALLDRRVSS